MNKNKKTSILLVDDHEIVIEGIKSALKSRTDLFLAGEAQSGHDAINLVKSLQPDIVIMDISMPQMDGIETTKQLLRQYPDIKIIIYTMFSEKEYIIELVREGVSGFVLKQEPISNLIMSIDVVIAGGTYFSNKAPRFVSEHLKLIDHSWEVETKKLDVLSQREKEVFQLLADGKTIHHIANKLCISPKTVESHKYNIMAKLGVKSMTDLTKIGIKYKLIRV